MTRPRQATLPAQDARNPATKNPATKNPATDDVERQSLQARIDELHLEAVGWWRRSAGL